MQIVEENEEGTFLQSYVCDYGDVACEDLTLPVEKLKSFICTSFDAGSCDTIELFVERAPGLKPRLIGRDVKSFLLEPDGSRKDFFVRSQKLLSN